MSNGIKAIILGGTGLLGKALAQKFAANGIAVTLSGRNEGLPGYGFVKLDALTCTDYSFLSSYDVVIDCLGQVTNPITICASINTTASLQIAMAVAGTGIYYVKISSLAVYGSADLVTEETPCNPDSAYGALKLASENIFAELLSPENYLNIRLSNLYGDTANKGVIAYLKREWDGSKSIFFDNDGSLLRYFIHVEDAVDIIDNLVFGSRSADGELQGNSGTINLPGPEKHTVKSLIAAAEAALGISYETSFKKSDFVWGNIKDISTEKLAKYSTLQYKHTISDYFKKLVTL